ncbi:hypothetical protein MLD38_019388 [Melastoma candidum]|uniref:Uncharacterized protein n=1 Tax=Melastoma candidum TaxID=119954 RepID=A0ACB9R0D0_9MYRT|nr:hypothetical protein MLD38_019388 [Melastoma candidum]
MDGASYCLNLAGEDGDFNGQIVRWCHADSFYFLNNIGLTEDECDGFRSWEGELCRRRREAEKRSGTFSVAVHYAETGCLQAAQMISSYKKEPKLSKVDNDEPSVATAAPGADINLQDATGAANSGAGMVSLNQEMLPRWKQILR